MAQEASSNPGSRPWTKGLRIVVPELGHARLQSAGDLASRLPGQVRKEIMQGRRCRRSWLRGRERGEDAIRELPQIEEDRVISCWNQKGEYGSAGRSIDHTKQGENGADNIGGVSPRSAE